MTDTLEELIRDYLRDMAERGDDTAKRLLSEME